MSDTAPPMMSPPLGAPGSVLPSHPASRNIIILLDGTGNQFSAHNSNVIKLMSVLRVDDQQLVYYSSGLGTILPDGFASYEALKAGVAKLSDEVLALNFDHFVQDAYQYLMDYYHAGDKIYIFGFSRGAYTARALAGMIQQVGLLPPGNHNQIKLAYEVYANPDKYKPEFDKLHKITTVDKDGKRQELSRDPGMLYRGIFGVSRTVDIEYLGVWDTVSSLGGFSLPELPFAAGVSSVNIFRQALALDERRARFEPEYRKNDYQIQDLLDGVARAQVRLLKAKQAKADAAALDSATAHLDRWKAALNVVYPDTVKVKGVDRYKSREVWFMGCHSDVGGGNANNDVAALANIPFRWMLREAVRFGLQLDPSGFVLCDALVSGTILGNPKLSTATVDAVKALRTILDDQERLAAEETKAGEQREKKAGGHWGSNIWAALMGKTDKGVEGPDEPPVMDEKRIRKSTKSTEADNRDKIYALWSVLKQEELAKVVEVAASLDTVPIADKDGSPVPPNKDVLSKLHESLTATWKVVEWIPLVLRGHTVSGKEEDEIKQHKSEGRQMIPHQKLHKSILRRLEYERRAKVADAYIPAADIPEAWPTWKQLKADTQALPNEFLEE